MTDDETLRSAKPWSAARHRRPRQTRSRRAAAPAQL